MPEAKSLWRDVDLSKFNLVLSDKETDGVHIRLFVSPYDVPEAVRGYLDDDSRHFVVEFKYLDSEPSRQISHEGVNFRVGKHSRRLYALELDVDHMDAKAVHLAISAIDGLTEESDSAEENHKITKELLGKLASKIVAFPSNPTSFGY